MQAQRLQQGDEIRLIALSRSLSIVKKTIYTKACAYLANQRFWVTFLVKLIERIVPYYIVVFEKENGIRQIGHIVRALQEVEGAETATDNRSLTRVFLHNGIFRSPERGKLRKPSPP